MLLDVELAMANTTRYDSPKQPAHLATNIL
jgi:hypothetical protein